MKHKSGYILLLTLLLLSLSIAMVTRLVSLIVARYHQSALFIKQEKARQLALGGVQLVLSALNAPLQQKEKKEEQAKQEELLKKNIFSMLNRWQKITLHEKIEGIDGEIQLYVSSELGKINLNALYDFDKKKFLQQDNFDARKVITWLGEALKESLEGINLIEILENFLKNHQGPLNDITELLTLKELNFFQEHIFIAPQEDKEKKQPIILTDLFTIAGKSPLLQPTQLSASMGSLLGLEKTSVTEEADKESAEFAKQIKPMMNWQVEWNKLLAPFVGKEYNTLPPAIRILFSPEFEAQAFSVVSYGNVDTILQKIYVIIEKKMVAGQELFMIQKVYWL
ncbi:MAG: hypothetical protein WA432_04730 [Candidatus Babeliaceae bacterium]